MGSIDDMAALNARGPTSGFTDVPDDFDQLPEDLERQDAKIFKPLRVGAFELKHRIVHAALGRSRSAYGIESPLAAEYFLERSTPGGLVISQATSVTLESIPWPWSAALVTEAQVDAVSGTIAAVHEKGGLWFHQLTHVGRCTSPSLVKRAWEEAGHQSPPSQGYQSVSASAVPESGINTHSGEPFGIPRPLNIEEIQQLRKDFKDAAARAVRAGADGIEVLSGNGFLLDQFLHDNINRRTDAYGGTEENRARLVLEIVDDIAEVVGYQKIGLRLSPFSNFHETDGSQPLEQLLFLARQLALRGVAYINVGEPRVSRNLDVAANITRLLNKGIPSEDISLKPFKTLLAATKPLNPDFIPTRLFGSGGYTSTTAILTVEDDLAEGVVFGRQFISNPDLVKRIRHGWPLSKYDRDTFYTHGAKGFLGYPLYEEDKAKSLLQLNGHSQTKKRVAIIGAGVSGIVSASALKRLNAFEVKIFDRNMVPGGSWVYSPESAIDVKYPSTIDLVDNTTTLPQQFPITLPRSKASRYLTTPMYNSVVANIPAAVMSEGSSIPLPLPAPGESVFLDSKTILEAINAQANNLSHLIMFQTAVENVEQVEKNRLRLTLREEVNDDEDHWYQAEFDHVIVATGHNSVPHVPDIPGLDIWRGELQHSVLYRGPRKFRGKRLLIVGTAESAIDICLQSIPEAKLPIYVSQNSAHPRYPDVFTRHGVSVVTTIKELTEDMVILNDGTVLADIDVVVFATGYFYTYPFLHQIRPRSRGKRVPGLYQHVFDSYNPNIAFIGVANASLSWLTWEKSAFLAGLLWTGKISLPDKTAQLEWERKRLEDKGDRYFHVLTSPAERVLYFEDLNLLASEYLASGELDDDLLRSYPYEWMLTLITGHKEKRKFYGLDPASNGEYGRDTS